MADKTETDLCVIGAGSGGLSVAAGRRRVDRMGGAVNTSDVDDVGVRGWARMGGTATRAFGWVLVILALAALAYELHASIQAGGYRMIEAGALWFSFDVGSLNLAQAIVQRFIHPYLWDPVVAGMLQGPAWSLLGGPGVALVLAIPMRGDQP